MSDYELLKRLVVKNKHSNKTSLNRDHLAFSSLLLAFLQNDVPAASATGRFCMFSPQVLTHAHTDAIRNKISIRENYHSFYWTLELLVMASTCRTSAFASAIPYSTHFLSLCSFEIRRNLERDGTFTLPYINKSIGTLYLQHFIKEM